MWLGDLPKVVFRCRILPKHRRSLLCMIQCKQGIHAKYVLLAQIILYGSTIILILGAIIMHLVL